MTIPFISMTDFAEINGASSCQFQTPTKRESLIVVTPPETPSKHFAGGNCRKRQRIVAPCEDNSLFLPELSDLDSPVRFPRRRFQSCDENNNKRICRIPSTPVPMMPFTFDDKVEQEEEEASPTRVTLAPRFQRERIMDLASDLMSNKRIKLTPTATPTFIPFPLDL